MSSFHHLGTKCPEVIVFSVEIFLKHDMLLSGQKKRSKCYADERGPEALKSPYLRRTLGQAAGVLTCREEDGFRIAVPRDDTRPFPLEAMFCFAVFRRVEGKPCWVFRFNGREWPVF